MRRGLAAVLGMSFLLTSAWFSAASGATNDLSSGDTQTGKAACYNTRLKGHRTSSGQRYNPKALTAGHATIPLGTQVKVTNVENGRSVVVTVNDHMSAHAGGIIMDISQHACKELGFPRAGEAKVKLEAVSSATH